MLSTLYHPGINQHSPHPSSTTCAVQALLHTSLTTALSSVEIRRRPAWPRPPYKATFDPSHNIYCSDTPLPIHTCPHITTQNLVTPHTQPILKSGWSGSFHLQETQQDTQMCRQFLVFIPLYVVTDRRPGQDYPHCGWKPSCIYHTII